MTFKQKIQNTFQRHELLISIFALFLIVVIAYVPSMKGAGYYGDDYHIVFGASTSGVERLLEIARIDRPFQGYTFSLFFTLFGINIHAYQAFEIALNLASALLAFWMIRAIWPEKKALAFLVSALMSVYPGYTNHMMAFNYCLFMFNFFIYLLSFVFTVKAELAKTRFFSLFFSFLALLTGLWGVLLNEYYIGLEVFRIGIFYLFASRDNPGKSHFWKKIKDALLKFVPYLTVMIGFVIWRFFIFHNQRNATDLGSFTSAFLVSPFYSSLSVLKGLLTNFLNVTLLAWFGQLYRFINTLRLKDLLSWSAIALIGALTVVWIAHRSRLSSQKAQGKERDEINTIVICSLTILATLFPIVFSQRDATFEAYGRYALPGMFASVLLLVTLIDRYISQRFGQILLGLLIFSGILTQLGTGTQLVSNWQGSKELWWQLSWRAPSIQKFTLLTGSSSEYAIGEGFNLWAPASLIYYPESKNPAISGEALTTDLIQLVMEDIDTVREFRSYTLFNETGNLLVLSRPSKLSCLHLIDGKAPTYSVYDSPNIMLIGPYSKLERVDTAAAPVVPPANIFGSEPAHGWCFYYEKADLAFQKGDYNEVMRLKNEADEKGYKQGDASELLPFLLAYAQTGNEAALKQILPIYVDSGFLKANLCKNLDANSYGIDPSASRQLFDLTCQ